MKSNEEIQDMIEKKQFDGVRYACIERVSANRTDAKAWSFLGTALIALQRVQTARLCFDRAWLFNPMSQELERACRQAAEMPGERVDERVHKLLQVPSSTVSANVLTKNNESTIHNCLGALKNAVDEIVVVDTGSTDKTIDIVKSFGIDVHRFEWVDDFSKARNFALSLSSSDWVIAVDSDEYLVTPDVPAIRQVAGIYSDYPDPVVVLCIQLNYVNGRVGMNGPARMFKNDGKINWSRRIHEYPVPVGDASTLTVHKPLVRVRLNHFGYDPSTVNTEEKCKRNLQLLYRDLDDYPDDARTMFYIGREHAGLGNKDKALEYLTLARSNMTADDKAYFQSELEQILTYLESI